MNFIGEDKEHRSHFTEEELYISDMLEYAEANMLLLEVVTAYTNYIRSGDSVAEAVGCALYDWDIG